MRKPARDGNPGFQIDLIIRRCDRIVHLCEIKLCNKEYAITKEYEQKLRDRQLHFSNHTGITHGIVHTFITPHGVNDGKYRGIIHSEVHARRLFQPRESI